MKLSVIICTHNPREEFIRRTLEALRKQTLPLTEWELLLIDNASQPPLAERMDISWHPMARQLLEPKLGKLNAWLLGMHEARGDVLLFVDDDNVLAPDYLAQALVVGAEWPFVGAWGGSVIPEYEVPLPDWVGDQVWRLTAVNVTEDVWSNLREGFATYPAGAGLCIRRSVAGRYLEWCRTNKKSSALDRSGKGLAGYGDMDLCRCSMDVGLGAGRSTKLKLTHLIPASRLTLDYFVRHAEGDAASYLAYCAIRGLPYRELARHSWFKSLVWWLHCLKRRVPREQREIHAAHLRGLKRGLLLAEEISKSST
jgi:glycosyltransferase involved in cell wall biosynthesis